jgi:hypothetical protein
LDPLAITGVPEEGRGIGKSFSVPPAEDSVCVPRAARWSKSWQKGPFFFYKFGVVHFGLSGIFLRAQGQLAFAFATSGCSSFPGGSIRRFREVHMLSFCLFVCLLTYTLRNSF